MKKQFTLFIIIIFIFFSSCSDYTKGDEKRFISYKKMQEDYEYFWDFIYTGYPFTEVCERRGVDLEQIKKSGVTNLSNLNTEVLYYNFYRLLCNSITSNKYTGHLYASDYYDYKNAFLDSASIPIYINQLSLIDRFYDKMPKTVAVSNYHCSEIPLVGSRSYSWVKTKILDPKKIAYINIDSFWIVNSYEKQDYIKAVDKFFMETADYKHIIIDIRNNGGGSCSNYEVLITPNLKSNKAVFRYSLYNENKYTLHILNYYLKNEPSTVDLIEKSEVPNVENCGTIKNDKAIKIKDVLASKPIFGYKPCEDKKFWLLVGKDVYSAADRFTDICKKTGFATVVGERTKGAGLNGYYPAFIVLPNSGLLIKFDYMYGLTEDGYCTDEFGTAPDIYNLPGKDALETCLEEIKKLGGKTSF